MLQARLDRLSGPELAITSCAEPVDSGSARSRKRIGVSSVAFPSPRPLPWGEGESLAAKWRIERAGSRGCLGVESRSARYQRERRPTQQRRGMRCPLSLRERARVRGNETPPTKTAG